MSNWDERVLCDQLILATHQFVDYPSWDNIDTTNLIVVLKCLGGLLDTKTEEDRRDEFYA